MHMIRYQAMPFYPKPILFTLGRPWIQVDAFVIVKKRARHVFPYRVGSHRGYIQDNYAWKPEHANTILKFSIVFILVRLTCA